MCRTVNQCIPAKSVCDDTNQCDDGSDEDEVTCSQRYTTRPPTTTTTTTQAPDSTQGNTLSYMTQISISLCLSAVVYHTCCKL